VAFQEKLMRRWLALAALLFAPPALAAPQDSWTIDQRASALTFAASQVGAFVNGRFPTWTGEIVLEPSALAGARIDIRIQTPPVTANNRDVDSLLKGVNFLDVQKFPEARFVATSVTAAGGDRYEARGKLTIRDITRDAVLPFTLAIADDPARPGQLRATARGRLIVKRLDYGVGQGEWAGTSQVANEVTIDLTVVASRPK
jgi:polyisoprenoid-binding protein YceI